MPPQEDLTKRVADLDKTIQMLRSSGTIPFDIGKAFEARIKSGGVKKSTKGADSEDQAVDEGGASTYNVPKEYDAFLEVVLDGTTYYIGVYT